MSSKFGLRLILPLFFSLFLFASCQSINRTSAEMGIPHRAVILTFDDGPDPRATATLLDVLQRHQVRAMFFLLGENAARYPELVRRIHDEGHIVANHGFADRMAHRMGDEEFRDNLTRGREAISAALGFEPYPRLYRPHGGFYRARHERVWLEEGYVMVPVSVRTYDAVATARNRDRVVRRTIRGVERQGGGVILLHDGRGSYYNRERRLARNPDGAFNRTWVPEAVEEIIVELLGRGFVFGDVDIKGLIMVDNL